MNFLISITELGGDLTSADGAKAAAIKVARSLFYLINSLIYEIITNLYTLFEYICNARLLQSEQFQSISEKIGLILGMIMLFRVIFNFIQILLDPDKINDKEIGAVSIIKKFLIVIVMLGCSSFFFNTMFHIQKFILNEKVIYKLILPSDQTIDTENFGAVLSARTFTTFYNVNNTLLSESISEAEQCNSYRNLLINRIVQNNDFSTGNYCLTAWGNVNVSDAKGNTQQISAFIMDYNFVLQFAVGLALVYLLFMYALKVGVRVIQLTVLQIISPMAIVSYLSPKKDNMFSKWWKIYFSTYIDAFIRVAIIYFVVYLSSILLDTIERGTNTFWESVGDPTDTYTRTVFIIAMILALLTFAKKAPDLIKELLPASASKLGFGASMKDIVGLQKGIGTVAGIGTGAAIGLLGGAIGGARAGYERNGILSGIGHGLTGALGGVTGGLFRGGHAGFGAKGLGSAMQAARKNQSQINKRNADLIANGGTWLGSRVAAAQSAIGMRTAADIYDEEKSTLESENALYNQLAGYFDAAKGRAKSKIEDGDFKLEDFHGNSTAYDAALAAMKQKQKIELLKASAANLDTSTEDGRTKLADLNNKIANETATYNTTLETAMQNYMDYASDAVVTQNMNMARQVLESNSKLEGFQGSTITNFASFKSANNKAKGAVSDNNVKLTQNASRGKTARTNAKR